MKRKRSFFERITGTIDLDDHDFEEVDINLHEDEEITPEQDWLQDPTPGGELSIDMYQTDNEIVIQAMVAGVKPEDLDISVNRELVTIEGHREGPHGIPNQDYYHQELYWGSFTRTIVLPEEVEVEECEAIENHGLLILRLPKLDKARSTKLRVKSRP